MDWRYIALIAVSIYYVRYLYNNGKFDIKRTIGGIISFCLTATALLFNAYESIIWFGVMAAYAGLRIGGIL